MIPSGTAKLASAAQSPTVNRLRQTMGVNPFADVDQRVSARPCRILSSLSLSVLFHRPSISLQHKLSNPPRSG